MGVGWSNSYPYAKIPSIGSVEVLIKCLSPFCTRLEASHTMFWSFSILAFSYSCPTEVLFVKDSLSHDLIGTVSS